MTPGRARDPAGGPSPRRARGGRAQTTIDFMIGAGVFLLITGFVLGMVPGMIDPFSDSQETTIVADRLATQIAEGMLAVPDRPTVLDETCTFAFFNTTGSGADCPVAFNASETHLPTRLGVQDRQAVNVTIERDVDGDGDRELLRTDGEHVSTSGHTRLAIGPEPPARQSTIAASRTAFIDGQDVTVVVRVW